MRWMRSIMIELICEFANMICGSTITRLRCPGIVTLAPPHLIRQWPGPEAAAGNPAPNTSVERWLDTGEGVVRVAFETGAAVVILRKIKVLVVDDSALVRRVLSDAISQRAGHGGGGNCARSLRRPRLYSQRYIPDVVTLDIEMPRMDGLTFLDQTDALPPAAGDRDQLGGPCHLRCRYRSAATRGGGGDGQAQRTEFRARGEPLAAQKNPLRFRAHRGSRVSGARGRGPRCGGPDAGSAPPALRGPV